MTLESTGSLFVLDAFRVPYVVARETDPGVGCLGSKDGTRELRWVEQLGSMPAWHTIEGIRVFAAVARRDEMAHLLRDREWREETPVLGLDGNPVSALWRAGDGSVLLPFDPNQLVLDILSERYARAADRHSGTAQALARQAYYRLRPLMPRGLQLALRRRYMRVQNRVHFPRWPVETSLHDLYTLLLGLVEEVSGEPLPWLAPWPDGCAWLLVVTHDVERRGGYDFVDRVLDVERAVGIRSAWYFVPERDYVVTDERVRSLVEDGFEVGLHGLRHDGRDLATGSFEERLPAMLRYAKRWGAVGFRSPATHRDWARMPALAFDYDTSYSDIARYEPIAGGSCTWQPFFINGLVELPITMPMDHTLFELLGERDETRWLEKAAFLKREGGMALLLTHPDYLRPPDRLSAYRRFLESTVHDPTVWHALPREVSAWWRARAATVPMRTAVGWVARGEAAERARVIVGAPRPRLDRATDRYPLRP